MGVFSGPWASFRRNYAKSTHVVCIDGIDDENSWRTSWTDSPRKTHPHELAFDIGQEKEVAGLRYSACGDFGRLDFCRIYVSTTPNDRGTLAAEGRFASRDQWQTAVFEKPVHGRYITIESVADWNNSEFATAREIHLYVTE